MGISFFDIRVQTVYGIEMKHSPALFMIYIYYHTIGKIS